MAVEIRSVAFVRPELNCCAGLRSIVSDHHYGRAFDNGHGCSACHRAQNNDHSAGHDSPATFEGVLLWELLSSAGVALGDKLRGPRMTEVVIIEAADGYKVAFALAELDSAFTSSKAILADKRDGKPLSAKEGPFRIVVPSDKRPARWVRQVTALRVVVAN